MIIIDAREPKYMHDMLKAKGIDVKREFLEIGDYALPGDVIIERKTGSDFIQSIKDNRLWDQLKNLKQYELPILVIESNNIWKDMYFSKSDYIHKSYFSTIGTIAVSFGIPVITVDSRDDTIMLIESLYRKLTSEGDSSRPVKKMRKARDISEVKEDMLAQIPGLSIKKSKKILECFGTIQNVANASEEELSTVEGIGEKLSKIIYQALH